MNIKKEDFINTKWDASQWSDEQKTKWQEYMFNQGFSWWIGEKVQYLNKDYYFIREDNELSYTTNPTHYGVQTDLKECRYEDVFPDYTKVSPEEPCLFENLIDHTNKYGVVLTVTHDAVEISYDDLGGLDIVVYNQEELDQVLAAIKLLQDKIN